MNTILKINFRNGSIYNQPLSYENGKTILDAINLRRTAQSNSWLKIDTDGEHFHFDVSQIVYAALIEQSDSNN